jgi:hypothetical protein
VRWILVCLSIAGCARAGKENSIIGGLPDARPGGDAGEVPEPDASLIDAPPAQVTLSATTSGAIASNHSFGCVTDAERFTLRNSYYRVFTLADFNLTTTLHVTQVDFGIQTATAGSGAQAQPATVHLGTYAVAARGDTLDLSQVREVNAAAIQIANGSASRMAVPITGDIAPSTSVIVELAIPDGATAGNRFFIGTNAQGERSPGYIMSPEATCGITTPTAMGSIGRGEVDMVMTITGTTGTPD